MVTPVYAPDIATYAARSPYITRSEFREAGTGADVAKLVPARASSDEQDAALDRVIARASSWADTYCRKILAATVDTSFGRVRWDRNTCSVGLPVPYTPIVAVTAVSLGNGPTALTPLTDLSGVWIDQGKIIRVVEPTWAAYTWMQASYVNGWANARLTAAAAAGATSITVDNPLGIYPGMTLTVDDGGASEQATVAAGYVPGSATVTLAAGLTDDHAVGVAATMMPQAIKEAVILYTAALIRTKGASAIVMGSLSGQPEQVTSSLPGGSREQQLAEELLAPHRRTW